MTDLFHKVVQKWKYPVKCKIPLLFMSKRNVFTLIYYISKSEGSYRWHLLRTPYYTNWGSKHCECFSITDTICLIWGFALLRQILALLWLLLVRLTHRSTSSLSEHFHLKQINLFALSESLLFNWVVLIEVIAFWCLY